MDHLKGILKDGFFPRYCPEYTLDPVDRKAASKRRPPMRAAPMVCFCDLPLSLIRKHLKVLLKGVGPRQGIEYTMNYIISGVQKGP